MKRKVIIITLFFIIILGGFSNILNASNPVIPNLIQGFQETMEAQSKKQGLEPAKVNIATLDENASATQIYAAIRTYLDTNSDIVENILKPIIENEFSGKLRLNKWKETLMAKISEDAQLKEEATSEERKVALQGSINQHKEALNFIREALGENVTGDEDDFITGDEEWRAYVYKNFKDYKIEGTNRTQHAIFDDVIDDIDNYVPSVTPVSNEVTGKVSIILTIVTNVGIILSVLMPAILGIKYMLGSVEEKADYKKDMIPYIVGSVLLFGICGIVKLTQSIGEIINKI